jgi:hypothetical protein
MLFKFQPGKVLLSSFALLLVAANSAQAFISAPKLEGDSCPNMDNYSWSSIGPSTFYSNEGFTLKAKGKSSKRIDCTISSSMIAFNEVSLTFGGNYFVPAGTKGVMKVIASLNGKETVLESIQFDGTKDYADSFVKTVLLPSADNVACQPPAEGFYPPIESFFPLKKLDIRVALQIDESSSKREKSAILSLFSENFNGEVQAIRASAPQAECEF